MCVAISHSASAAPGRLRHSWLDNQVLLVLRPDRGGQIRVSDLSSLLRPWFEDLDDLDTYAEHFPSVTDPGVFLQQFAGQRRVTLPAAVSDGLSTRFAGAFREQAGISVAEFREQLGTSSRALRTELKALEDEVAGHGAATSISLSDLESVRTAFAAAGAVHRLLGFAPRGVWLP